MDKTDALVPAQALAPPPPAVMPRQRQGDQSSRMFSTSDAMMKQIQATHTPDGRIVDVGPILTVIEGIFHNAAPSIDRVLNGKHEHTDAFLEEKANLIAYDGILESLAHIIHRISCEISCKCTSGSGGDVHGTTMAIFNMLSTYTWDVKVVIALAAFAVNYGEFSLIANLYNTNTLAKSVALLKQLPDILEHSSSLKPQFDALNNLITAMLNVAKCILMFRELPPQYISPDTPPLSTALTHIPIAAYWTIRSIVACASQIASLIGLGHEYLPSATEAWELSSLAYKVSNIYDHLKAQLALCHQHMDEKIYSEAYNNLVRLFETFHADNMRILKALIYSKDDINPLLDGSSKARVSLEALRKKTVLLLISNLDITNEDIIVLHEMYKEMRERQHIRYEIVWLPVVDGNPRSPEWDKDHLHRFTELQAMMPWHSVHHPSVIEPYVAKYIRDAWRFSNRTILAALDPQGKVVSSNALHMMWIWGNLAFPFTKEREEELWKGEVWRLELVVDALDPTINQWMSGGKYICLYGGDDIEWIRKFTSAARHAAESSGITLEMAYVGKNNAKERVRKTAGIVSQEKLSRSWVKEETLFWYFWARLESMLYSKLQQGKSIETDLIMREVMTILSYDSSEGGWAMFCHGLMPEMARANGASALESMVGFERWKEKADREGLIPALKEHLEQTHSPHHCSRLILPGIAGDGIPERVVCAECGRAMEKFIMYRCCIE